MRMAATSLQLSLVDNVPLFCNCTDLDLQSILLPCYVHKDRFLHFFLWDTTLCGSGHSYTAKVFSIHRPKCRNILLNKKYIKVSKEEYIEGVELNGSSNKQDATGCKKEGKAVHE